jgi:hypothetical protein
MTKPRPLLGVAVLLAGACASGPSARWTQGGAVLDVGNAYWTDGDSTVEILPSGEIREADELLFRIDESGRISSADGARVAVLLADGSLVAEADDAPLGWVGRGTSLRADRRTPSVYMFPSGQVVIADGAGGWDAAGYWIHCDGGMLWTCTLVTHVLAARDRVEGSSGGSSDANPFELLRLLELLKLAH